MHQIRPRLWLGSLEAVKDTALLTANKISHVLTCGRMLDESHEGYTLPDGVERLTTLPIDDLDEVDILEHFPPTSDEIKAALARGSTGILVHCASGKSRSASVVMAYLLREEGLAFAEAYKQVTTARPVARPNDGFSHQLEWYGANGCPSEPKYKHLPEFRRLLRRYTAGDVCRLIRAAAVGEEGGGGSTVEPEAKKARARSDPDDPDGAWETVWAGVRVSAAGSAAAGGAATVAEQIKQATNAIEALDRLQNAIPADDAARDERRAQNRRLNSELNQLLG